MCWLPALGVVAIFECERQYKKMDAHSQQQVPVNEPYTIGFWGLSRWDEMLLRSMLRMVDSQTRNRWKIEPAQHYAVAFYAPNVVNEAGQSPPPARLMVAYTSNTVAGEAAPFQLLAPARLNSLRDLLDRIGEGFRHEGGINSQNDAADTDGLFEVLARVLKQRTAEPSLLKVGERALATINGDRNRWYPHMPLPELATALLGGGPFSATSAAEGTDTHGEHPIMRLLLLLAENVTHAPLLAAIDTTRPMKLSAWVEIPPDGNLRDLIPLAAALLRRPMTLAEIQAQARIPKERLAAWLNACALGGRLMQTTPVPVQRNTVADSAPVSEQTRGFVARLRRRLGLA